MSRRTRTASAAVILLLSVGAGSASAANSSADTAALQVALWARGVYVGPVDGVFGPDTAAAVRALQSKLGLPSSGVFGPRTRRALGHYASKTLGSRRLRSGMNGWDVAAFQFMLAWHGFPSGAFNGAFSPRTESALISFERWAGLPADGRSGPAVLRALHRPPPRSPISLGWPLLAPLGSPFGPRGDGFHAGIDLVAPAGDPVIAAGAGQVVYAGWRDGGWGNEVTINHGCGVRAIYAHLSKVTVTLGESVSGGERIGLVGATGAATGPHLHFELRLNGAAVDPLTALPTEPPAAGPAPAPGGALARLPGASRPGGAGARVGHVLPVSAVDALGAAVVDQAAQAASHRLPGTGSYRRLRPARP
ncbi:MAG TPA: peptidoglycan DD-metalloendopeptidase family protein [Gaiellaceae bacterium]|nr:peptidoglycan DD-metalloendopeptidase family protein [Gaiellaceae bacterium]